MPTLDATKQLVSDLWLDQPDAHDRIDARVAVGTLAAVDAGLLHQFTDEGFTTLRGCIDDDVTRGFDDDLDTLWQTRPFDLAAAPKVGERRSFRDMDTADRSIGYRVVDMHSHSPRARQLYLHEEIFRVVELIFDQPAIAFQSLYFQFGSEQSLHRDPMFVVTKPASHLVASWIALEDITPDSGPLLYAPGSHRMPWYEFEADKVNLDHKEGVDDKRREWSEHRRRMLEAMNLEAKPFTCKRGDVFIWHGGLLHGGARVDSEAATRKSFVVHYSTAANYRSRQATMQTKVSANGVETWRGMTGTTDRVLTEGHRRGIDNPLHGVEPPEMPQASQPAREPVPERADDPALERRRPRRSIRSRLSPMKRFLRGR